MAAIAVIGAVVVNRPKPSAMSMPVLVDARHEPQHNCLPYYDDLMSQPDWELEIVHGTPNWTGNDRIERWQVNSGGLVVWSRPGEPDRTFRMTWSDLFTVIDLDTFDCSPSTPRDPGEDWFRTSTGGHYDKYRAVIPASSTLGRLLETFFDTALDDASHDDPYYGFPPEASDAPSSSFK